LCTNLLEVLALELSNELVQALLIGVNANGREDSLNVLSGGGGVASKGEEQVSGEVLHFESARENPLLVATMATLIEYLPG
jgi:hypothetical protein